MAADAGLVTTGPNSKVIFLFGETQPSVVCSLLQVCDIELQGGEIVRDVLVGDTVRWKVESTTSGATGGQAIHLIVKPSKAGLITSMVVTTSRWTYRIQLKSDPSEYMARVGFEYTEDVLTKLADVNARVEVGGLLGASADKLNFSYSVSGSAAWKPKRVYSDSNKTYIQFPKSISGQDAPIRRHHRSHWAPLTRRPPLARRLQVRFRLCSKIDGRRSWFNLYNSVALAMPTISRACDGSTASRSSFPSL
jgi:type IV secretion system protein VirB9